MWVTVKNYARAKGVTETAVRHKIKHGTIDFKKINGVLHVDDGNPEPEPDPNADAIKEIAENVAEQDYRKAISKRWDTDNELKRQKIENIRADIIIKKQKVKEYRERLRTEFCEGVLDAYSDAFGDLKAVMVDLKLRKEQIKKFKDTYSKCLKKFEQKLIAYLKTKDDDEEKESEKE